MSKMCWFNHSKHVCILLHVTSIWNDLKLDCSTDSHCDKSQSIWVAAKSIETITEHCARQIGTPEITSGWTTRCSTLISTSDESQETIWCKTDCIQDFLRYKWYVDFIFPPSIFLNIQFWWICVSHGAPYGCLMMQMFHVFLERFTGRSDASICPRSDRRSPLLKTFSTVFFPMPKQQAIVSQPEDTWAARISDMMYLCFSMVLPISTMTQLELCFGMWWSAMEESSSTEGIWIWTLHTKNQILSSCSKCSWLKKRTPQASQSYQMTHTCSYCSCITIWMMISSSWRGWIFNQRPSRSQYRQDHGICCNSNALWFVTVTISWTIQFQIIPNKCYV